MVDIRCKSCNRYLKINPVATTICTVTCEDRRCKAVNNIKVVFYDATPEQRSYTFPTTQEVEQIDTIKVEAEQL